MATSNRNTTVTPAKTSQPFASENSSPIRATTMKRMRRMEKRDFFLITAPHCGQVGAVEATGFLHSGQVMRAIFEGRNKGSEPQSVYSSCE